MFQMMSINVLTVDTIHKKDNIDLRNNICNCEVHGCSVTPRLQCNYF